MEQLEDKIAKLHRSVLEKDVLRGVLPLRAATARCRSEQPDARDREARLRGVSPAYAREIDNHDDDAHARALTLDSLTWWVPLLSPDDPAAVSRALGHQDFPYRVITQTREVGLGGVMLDIGANTGRMSVPRVILGDVTAAYCAEPDPLNYRCLVRNVRDNCLRGLVLPDHLAIASEDGVVRLERGKSTGGHRVLSTGEVTVRDVLDVPAMTLDSWVDRLGIDRRQIAFVKVDVQGLELQVLRGASRTLAQSHVAWQIEVDIDALGRGGRRAGDLYAEFRRSFSHFIDLSRRGTGARVRRIDELEGALEYLLEGAAGRTDLLLFTMASPGAVEHQPAGRSAQT